MRRVARRYRLLTTEHGTLGFGPKSSRRGWTHPDVGRPGQDGGRQRGSTASRP